MGRFRRCWGEGLGGLDTPHASLAQNLSTPEQASRSRILSESVGYRHQNVSSCAQYNPTSMSVIPLTLAISLCLVFTFVLFFLREHGRQRFSSAESDALLPLADEIPQLAGGPRSVPAESGAKKKHIHDHADGSSCGCKSGERPPCEGCLRRTPDDSVSAS